MFCPNCGLENQQAGAYCRRCGAIQPGPAGKIRIAGVTSGALALVSALILIWALMQPDTRYEAILTIAALCSLLVAAWQAYNVYLGYKISEPRPAPARDDGQPDYRINTPLVSALEQASFNTADLPISSITEHTTRTLEPVERRQPK